MKKITLIFALVVLLSNYISGQVKITELNFEGTGGYTTSIPEFTDLGQDYFLRTDGSNTAGEVFTNIQGNFYFAAQDIDGEGAALPVRLLIDDVNIDGYENLELRVHLAEDDDGPDEDWDAPDYVHFNYDIDNTGAFSTLLWIENDGSTFNSAPSIDTNYDFIGDGAEITDEFTQYSQNIFGTGNVIDIEIIFNLDAGDEDIAIDNIEIWGTLAGCTATTTWNGTIAGWDNVTGPDISTAAIINAPYATGASGSFTACNLIVNANLTVDNEDFVEIINDVTVNAGQLRTDTRGSFVQRGNNFTLAGGDAVVVKTTAILNTEEDYTYWSSPVANITIADGLTDANPNRRYTYDADNFLDIAPADGIDDDGNDWVPVTDTDPMEAGKGYVSMHGAFFFPLGTVGYAYQFEGAYNTGDITQTVSFNPVNTLNHWNLLGNPYPSAINADDFFAANSTVVAQEIFMWSQVSPPDVTNLGNEVLNFNLNDYITINSMGTAGNGTTPPPSRSVPSGQSFFVSSTTAGTVTFNNTMRASGQNVNDEFYRTSAESVNYTDIERLWVNLSSDVGIYSQICVAYADNATDDYDGKGIDTKRNYAGNAGLLYSMDNNNDSFYVIQGKAKSSLNETETINIGFTSYLSTSEIYSISLADFEGEYLENNPIFLKDNLLGVVHDIKASAYDFSSTGGDFSDRFEIVFQENALGIEEFDVSQSDLTIIELSDGRVQFNIGKSQTIQKVVIFDVVGREMYRLNGNSSTEIYNLDRLKPSAFVAQVELSNGQVITKKALKSK